LKNQIPGIKPELENIPPLHKVRNSIGMGIGVRAEQSREWVIKGVVGQGRE
jgi:hypothetical protein